MIEYDIDNTIEYCPAYQDATRIGVIKYLNPDLKAVFVNEEWIHEDWIVGKVNPPVKITAQQKAEVAHEIYEKVRDEFRGITYERTAQDVLPFVAQLAGEWARQANKEAEENINEY